MSKRSSREIGYQASKPHVMQTATEGKIIPVRRLVSPESHTTLSIIEKLLRTELLGAARQFEVDGLGVTVIGFSRFDRRHRGPKGPPTSDIVREVPGAQEPLEVSLGGLAVFGSLQKAKLGLQLLSDELEEEVHAFEDAFEKRGFPLKPDHNARDGVINLHCSIALLYGDRINDIGSEEWLHRVGHLVLAEVGEPTITLEPVNSIRR